MFKKAIRHLHKAAVYANLYKFGSDTCAICLGEFEEGEEKVHCCSSNLHEYHKECMYQWLQHKEENICPICKGKVLNVQQVNSLPDDIKKLIIDGDIKKLLRIERNTPRVRLEETSARELSQMFQNGDASIQYTDFRNADWRGATINLNEEEQHSFLVCKFYCLMDHSKIVNVHFYRCAFEGDLWSFSGDNNASTSMKRVTFKSVRFDDVTMTRVSLEGSTFDNCNLSGNSYSSIFDNCQFQGGSFDNFNIIRHSEEMSGCRFANVKLHSCSWIDVFCHLSEFVGCTIKKCDFSHATLEIKFVNCTFSKCDFINASIKSSFQNCKFHACNFTDANLEGSIFFCDRVSDGGLIDRSDFTKSQLESVTFECCKLEDNAFSQAEMAESKFSQCAIKSCTFSDFTNLKGASFNGSTIRNSQFTGVLMKGASFRECHIVECNFRGTDFQDVSFTKARLERTPLKNNHKKHGTFLDAVIDGVKQTEKKVISHVNKDTGSTHTFSKRKRGDSHDDSQEHTRENTQENKRKHIRWID